MIHPMWMVPTMGVPEIVHFNGMFHHKPMYFGVAPFMEPPFWNADPSGQFNNDMVTHRDGGLHHHVLQGHRGRREERGFPHKNLDTLHLSHALKKLGTMYEPATGVEVLPRQSFTQPLPRRAVRSRGGSRCWRLGFVSHALKHPPVEKSKQGICSSTAERDPVTSFYQRRPIATFSIALSKSLCLYCIV